jgi:hypothetical protein
LENPSEKSTDWARTDADRCKSTVLLGRKNVVLFLVISVVAIGVAVGFAVNNNNNY